MENGTVFCKEQASDTNTTTYTMATAGSQTPITDDKTAQANHANGTASHTSSSDSTVVSMTKEPPDFYVDCDSSNVNAAETGKKPNSPLKKYNVIEKITFLLAVATIIVLTLSLTNFQWFLPYYYTLATPFLLLIRAVKYCKSYFQYFLLDFCYFANTYCFICLWAAPSHPEAIIVLFAVSNGPLTWATFFFRNALVFHDWDKMISCYIHMLPMLMSFVLRWYPSEMSKHWYTNFNEQYSQDLNYMFVWIVAVPVAFYAFHTTLYLIIVYAICRPGDKYLNSFRYLAANPDSWKRTILDMCGENIKFQLLVYNVGMQIYSLLSVLLGILLYKYFIAHIMFISVITGLVCFNGATYYIDILPHSFQRRSSSNNSVHKQPQPDSGE